MSNQDQTTAGTNALAPGRIVYGRLLSVHICISCFHGSDSPGVPASDTIHMSFSFKRLR
nr:hypothetical protein [bacterium]